MCEPPVKLCIFLYLPLSQKIPKCFRCFQIRECLLEENYAPSGGGLSIAEFYSSVKIENCTFVNNVASEFGGAIRIAEGKGLTVMNTTIKGNSASTSVSFLQ